MSTRMASAVLLVFVLLAPHRPVSSVESECLETHSLFYGVVKAAESVLKESRCKAELKSISESFVQKEIWAIKLYDASGAPSPGIHWGNIFWLGSRSQCLAACWPKERYGVVNPKPDYRIIEPSASPTFSVDYFVAYMLHHSELQIPNNHVNETKIALGLCLPSSCQEEDIQAILRGYVTSDKFNFKDIYNTSLDVLEVKKTDDSFDTTDPIARLFMFVLLVIGSLVIAGTVYDYRLTKSNKKSDEEGENTAIKTRRVESDGVLIKILLGFSFIKHFNGVFNMADTKHKFKPISGIRVCTTISVLFCHGFVFLVDFLSNRTLGYTTFDTYLTQPVLNGHFTTDVFLCLSGFLMTYSFYSSKSPESSSFLDLVVSCVKDVFKRIVRFFPAYIFMMLVTIVLTSWTHKFDSLWFSERDDILCRENWWTNILFINNIYKPDSMCMFWTYYLALDMQLFFVITFCLHFSKKYLKSPVMPLTALSLASIVCLGYTTYVTNHKPYPVNFLQSMSVFYYPPWMRIGSYVIGALYGYAYHSLNKQLNIQQKWVALLWVGNIAAMAFVIFGFKDKNLSMPWALFHACFSRNIWAAGLGWIIFACLTNHGGLLNEFLSARIWLPISKLSYSAYLLNAAIVQTMASFSEKSYPFELMNLAVMFPFGLITLTYVLSVPLTCCVELPCNEAYNILRDWVSPRAPRDENALHHQHNGHPAPGKASPSSSNNNNIWANHENGNKLEKEKST